MSPSWLRCGAAAIVGTLSASAMPANPVFGQCGYEYTIMPFPDGYQSLSVADFNDSETVVGHRRLQGGSLLQSAYRWSARDGYVTLPPPPGGAQAWYATRVSSDGHIVGKADISALPQEFLQLVLWDPNDAPTLAPTPIPVVSFDPFVITNSGTASGTTSFGPPGTTPKPFLWSNGAFVEIPSGFDSAFGGFRCVNDLGWFGGGIFRPVGRNEFVYHAIMWDGELNTVELPALPQQFIVTELVQIGNDLRGCVKATEIRGPEGALKRTFLWDGSVFTLVGPNTGSAWTRGNDRNEVGQIVGASGDSAVPQSSYPIVWQDGTMTDLRSLATLPATVKLGEALRVLEDGRILCLGTLVAGNKTVGVILRPNAVAEDINIDCHVDAKDLAIVLGAWGPVLPTTIRRADVDGDGEVGAFDLAAVLGAWSTLP